MFSRNPDLSRFRRTPPIPFFPGLGGNVQSRFIPFSLYGRPVRRGGAGGAVCTPPNPVKLIFLIIIGLILVQLLVEILEFSAPDGACFQKYQFNSFFNRAQEKKHIFTNSVSIISYIKVKNVKFVANLVIFL